MNLFRKKPKRTDKEIFQDDTLTDSEKIDEYVKNHGGDPKISKKEKEAVKELLKTLKGNGW